MGNDCSWVQGFFWGERNTLELVLIHAQLCEYSKSHRIAHFKGVNIMVYILRLSQFKKSHQGPGGGRFFIPSYPTHQVYLCLS